MPRVRRFIKRRGAWVGSALTVVAILASGLYVNEVSEHGVRVGESLWLLVVAVACLVGQVWVDQVRSKPTHDVVHATIESLLEAAARALVHPKSIDQVPVRAFCHRANSSKQTLDPVCRWSYHHYNDKDVPIPYTGPGTDEIVIAKAFCQGTVIARELSPEWRESTRPDVGQVVWSDIRTVLSAPIKDFTDPNSEVLGTVTFDSSAAMNVVKFDKENAADIAALMAACIYRLWVG